MHKFDLYWRCDLSKVITVIIFADRFAPIQKGRTIPFVEIDQRRLTPEKEASSKPVLLNSAKTDFNIYPSTTDKFLNVCN